jgi:cyclopropane-fatty-acyl-phospholipid synthase
MLFSIQGIVDSLGAQPGIPFEVALPDGSRLRTGDGEPRFTIAFRSEAALLKGFTRGHIGLLEAFFDGEIDVDGDLHALFAAGMMSDLGQQVRTVAKVENDLLEWRRSNRSPAQAKDNARAHYGLGEPFYRLWLDDPLKMYTCGYWPEGTTSLEQAQRNKIDHVCRKIGLSRGERFVDVGCGFGGFMFRALETTGATGVGVNTTTEQVDWLRGEIARRGLQAQLSVREADFRDVDGQYDKVVSIGVLKPGGLGMLHFIGHVGRYDTELFIRKHVFPGGWIPSLADVIVEMERCGLEVIDVENLRRHYAPTLDAWAERFERNWETIRALDPARFDERFRRIWLTYLIGCAEMFRSPAGYTHLFQIVFSKGNVTDASYPMGRGFLYAG